ncbi:hypothetical protein SASPL_102913 [Salvia splendens]|uniref:Reverse transcriptase domain-containing protein n=1 Tax=Salvia splendens TaxID=180675 RepID=A0A8X9AD86_SALSN|nr:hypothetical protein SASPL_102913 [Salvia splendens]
MPLYMHRDCFPSIDQSIAARTSLPFRPSDVKDALFAMKPWKAPGVDGFQAGYYQRHWETVGKDICVELATKTIANRLKQLMPLIIGTTQSSCVAGRHIFDNIVIAQEAIHSMRNKSGKTGTMALKVDLEKAYDRVSWAFLFDTLNEAKLLAALVDMIMKQGCPLLPYLFVLCMERLAHGIEHAVKADVRTAKAFSNVLEEFCGSSGMKVRQCLGVPLLYRKVSKLTYARILDKMKAKIANWNIAQLSLAGRITLAQVVLSTMSLYAMQTSKLPVGVCAEMAKEIREFIWGSDRSNQRLSKACWEIFKQPMSLWATLLCSKYKFDPLLGFDPIAPASCTPFWRLICSSWDTMRRNLVWALGKGSSVQFWNQRWVPALHGTTF